jgi:hypothetical protein
VASALDICNLALSHLGDSANVSSIDPPEGSAQAEHCARFYPVARDSLLEMHNWSFATRRAQPALLAEDIDTAWSYAYAAPAGMVKPIAVVAPGTLDTADSEDYAVESLDSGLVVIYTNTENPVLRYVARVTDTTKYTPLFVDALSWLLASYLAGPIIKGDSGVSAGRACFQTFTGQFQRAASSDANMQKGSADFTPSSIAARDSAPTSLAARGCA